MARFLAIKCAGYAGCGSDAAPLFQDRRQWTFAVHSVTALAYISVSNDNAIWNRRT